MLIVIVMAVAFSTVGAHIAAAQITTETFLLVPGIPGESTGAGHEDWIDVNSFSQQLNGSKNDQGACTVEVVTPIDRAVSSLMVAVATGQMFDEIRLESFKVGNNHPRPFYDLTLSDAHVTSFSLFTNGSILTITGARATLRYFREDPKHGGGEESKVTVHCK